MKMDKQFRLALVSLIAVMLALAFTAALLFAFFPYILPLDNPLLHPLNLVVLLCAFFLFLLFAMSLRKEMFTQFARRFFDLSWEDAGTLVSRLLEVLPETLPFEPTLRIQDGRANPDGPEVLFKVGGPGYLSIAHNSAAVTSRLGKLHHVFGPGFHQLEPFERLWDVIDLRPQRRKICVEFMTSNGIPASCDAEIRFRVAGPSEEGFAQRETGAIPNQPYPFSEDAVLKLATNKFVKSLEGSNRIADWCIGLANGALDGIMRNILEKYSLDDFLNPRYWEEAQRDSVAESTALRWQRPGADAGAEPQHDRVAKPMALREIEAEVEERIRQTGLERGIWVDWVRLEPIRPAEAAVSRQWLEFWQAKSERVIGEYRLTGEAKQAQVLEQARTEAQVEFLTRMLREVQDLNRRDINVPSELILMSFVDVVRTLSEQDPAVQQMMFHQAESLIRIVTSIRRDKSPFGPATPPVTPVSPSGMPLSPDSPPDEGIT